MLYAQKPLVTTKGIKFINYDKMPAGHNAIVAICSYSVFCYFDNFIFYFRDMILKMLLFWIKRPLTEGLEGRFIILGQRRSLCGKMFFQRVLCFLGIIIVQLIGYSHLQIKKSSTNFLSITKSAIENSTKMASSLSTKRSSVETSSSTKKNQKSKT